MSAEIEPGTVNDRTPLAALLRPAGGGLHTVSTGRAEQQALQARLYDATDGAGVQAAWQQELARLPEARVALLGVPSDCGAGLVRGAAFGPAALRLALLEARPDWATFTRAAGIVDVGDIPIVPHLLHDEMLSEAQREACRGALFPALPPEARAHLPVSPLSLTEAVVARLLRLNPGLRVLVLGGDHSVAWPVVKALADAAGGQPFGIVQPDAHTDLLPERLGVRYCFATWAYHANDLLGRGGRLVQVGVRASSRPRAHWESTLGVRQFWAEEIAALGPAGALDAIVAHLRGLGLRRVYLSNDIDATDAAVAPATGAPEPRGLDEAFLLALIDRLGREFEVIGADLMEVAPPIGAPEEARRTIRVGAGYLLASLDAMLRSTVP